MLVLCWLLSLNLLVGGGCVKNVEIKYDFKFKKTDYKYKNIYFSKLK
tara:strand:- start:1295 stop:1435 length:141 start_codon:yes stop_codon:yes gene_type:complete